MYKLGIITSSLHYPLTKKSPFPYIFSELKLESLKKYLMAPT